MRLWRQRSRRAGVGALMQCLCTRIAGGYLRRLRHRLRRAATHTELQSITLTTMLPRSYLKAPLITYATLRAEPIQMRLSWNLNTFKSIPLHNSNLFWLDVAIVDCNLSLMCWLHRMFKIFAIALHCRRNIILSVRQRSIIVAQLKQLGYERLEQNVSQRDDRQSVMVKYLRIH